MTPKASDQLLLHVPWELRHRIEECMKANGYRTLGEFARDAFRRLISECNKPRITPREPRR